ncbi:MAG: DUF2779 domain-containing protein [Dehalococcoidia bacterium]|nr:DUF2779 domain-containing protein [Dehalococcoidia bacterium]
MLSKSRFTSGMQCLKRLYLESYSPGLGTPSGPGLEALFSSGTAAGILAQQLYPAGILVAEDYMHHGEATSRTRELLRDPTVSSLYEAAFTEDDIRIRADILARGSGETWHLVEVKSSTSVHDQYIDDVAVQLHVLEHAGVPVDRVSVAYINRDYVYTGGAHAVDELFIVEDVTDLARERLAGVPARLEEMRAALSAGVEPAIDIGSHCSRPYACQFTAYCRRNEPEWPLDELPGISAKRVDALRGAGYRSLATIPGSVPLNMIQQRVRDTVQSQQPWVADDLGEALSALAYPVHFIDFETVNTWLPRWVGTRPYQTFPFQWSDHVLHRDGALDHAEFLADGPGDPRRAFAGSLIEQLQGAGTLVVYSSYERSQLTALRDELRELESALERVLAVPQFDLLQVVRAGYYHPGFRGSFSLKSVLPVMVPALAYTDLAIQHGVVAALRFQQLWRSDLDAATRAEIRTELLAYCERDTLAMVRIVEALRGIAGGG